MHIVADIEYDFGGRTRCITERLCYNMTGLRRFSFQSSRYYLNIMENTFLAIGRFVHEADEIAKRP